MKLFLNNIFKGLLVALLVISLGGFLYINISKPEEINLQLISSSVVNQLGTESKNVKETKKENNDNKDLVEDKIKDENKEDKEVEDKKEDTTKTEEVKEEMPKEEVKEESKTEEKVEQKEETKQETTSKTEDSETKKDTETKTEEKKEETPVETKPAEPVAPKEEVKENNQSSNNAVTPKGGYNPNMNAVNSTSVIKTYEGRMTAYGPDCDGCGGMVAHGEYVGGGNIYYNDKTFGSIRIVAGDRSLKFGTIVRIKGISTEPIIAVVLDIGGAIGFNTGIYFDLLYESEAAASSFGRPKATFEILREGFKK